MKKVLLATFIAGGLVASAYAQGQIQFSTGPGAVLFNGASLPTGNPASVGTYGELNIAAYAATAGTALPLTATAAAALPSAWVESTTVEHAIAPLPGAVPGTTWTDNAVGPGGTAQVEILAWTGTFGDWNSALAAGTGLFAWTGSALSGGQLSWSQLTGNGNTVAAQVPPSGAVNQLVFQTIPEPSTFALAGLGAVALLIFRRRK